MKLTLRELQDKIWFRLLKVVWVGSLLLIFGVSAVLISNEYAERTTVDEYRTEVLCVVDPTLVDRDWEPCAFTGLKPGYKVLSRRPLASTRLNYISVEATKKACPEGILEEDLRDVCNPPREHEDLLDPVPLAERGSALVMPILKTTGGWTEIVQWTLVWWLCVYVVFEGVRRIFYYVVLGAWRPT